MKRVRKGFTLVELLIVIAIFGGLSAMMATSSTDAIDVSAASVILNNLQSMKTAAYSMYMERPEVAGMNAIANDTPTPVVKSPASGSESATYKTVAEVLGEFLGRIDIAAHYGIVGDANHWYVYYELQNTDSAKVQAVLEEKANAAGLLGAPDASVDGINSYGPYDYFMGAEYAVLIVR